MSDKDTSKMVLVPGELHSAASNHIVSGSDEIYDYGFDVRQEDLNRRFDSSIKEIATSGSDSVYDVTVKGGGRKFGSLYDLLHDASINDLIPSSVRKGGMSIKYVQSTDDKYVQSLYMNQDALTASKFTNVGNWQGLDEEPIIDSENFVRSGGIFSAIFNDRGQKTLVSISKTSKVDGNNVIINGFNFVFSNINNVEYRNAIKKGTYTLSSINSVLYVVTQANNSAELTPQISEINNGTQWNSVFNQKNVVVLAYTNSNNKIIFCAKQVQEGDIYDLVKDSSIYDLIQDSINNNYVQSHIFNITSVKIAEVNSWEEGVYDNKGQVKAYYGYHSEVNWDPQWPEMTVLMNWEISGTVRNILVKDKNDNIKRIFAPIGSNIYYPIIVKIPTNTSKLLVSKYVSGNKPVGNEIYSLVEAFNGGLGLIDRNVQEIINFAKDEILGGYEVDATDFPNTGYRLSKNGAAVSHSSCRLTNFIPLDGKVIKQIKSCFIQQESNEEYLSIAFYSEANEESFVYGINDITDSSVITSNWVLQTYNDVGIPKNAHYMRVTSNFSLSQQQNIAFYEYNTIPGFIYSDAPGEYEYFSYSVDCGIDDIEDSSVSTNIQGQTVLGTDNGFIRFSSNYSKSGRPTPLVILNHGAGGSVTSSSTENGNSSFAKLLAKKGYNVLCINGVPTTFRNTKYLNAEQNGAAAHMGGWVYQRSAISAYKYVTQKYNISKDGCAVIGRSMGGVTSLNLAMLGSIPVKVVALDAPVIDSYKDAYFSGGWSGGTLGGKTAAIFAWIFQWDYCDFTNDTYTIPVGEYTIHGNTYTISEATAKSLADLKNSTSDMIILWYLNRNKMYGYNAYKTGNYLVKNLDSSYIDNQTTDNDPDYYAKKLPCPCKIWFGSGDTVNQIQIANRFIQLSRNGGSVALMRTAPSNTHCIWAVTKALDGSTNIAVSEDGITCSPYGVELAEWIMRYLPNVSD